MLRSMLLAATMTLLAAAAAAQDVRPPSAIRDFKAHHSQIQSSCDEIEGLSLCVEPLGAARSRRVAKRQPGQLTRFTRLAGMFMGRVDAADWGPLRVRFNLELR